MVAGHTRLKAMQRILTEEPDFVAKGAPGPGMARVVFHEFDSESDAAAYAIADNKLHEYATWDEELLAEQLKNLSEEDRAIVGFEDTPPPSPDDPPPNADDEGMSYEQKFGVVVECADEREQQMAYEALTNLGYSVRVLTV
jgi:hypothetical protein